MGCNTSRDSTVVDPSEKPEERPKTAASTTEAPAVETNGTTNKDTENDQKADSTSWASSSHLILNYSESKKYDQLTTVLFYYLFINITLSVQSMHEENVSPLDLSVRYVLSFCFHFYQ